MSLAVRLCELRVSSARFVTDGNESHWVEDFMADAEEFEEEEGSAASVPPALHRGISSEALVPHENVSMHGSAQESDAGSDRTAVSGVSAFSGFSATAV